MDKIENISGLKVLAYLRTSGLYIDESLCAIVPDEIAKKQGKSKALCVIDTLIDDKKGELSSHFADYYDRFPEKTETNEVPKLQRGFQKFVCQILFGKKEQHKLASTTESTRDILGKRIDDLICSIRGTWVQWSIDDGYMVILQDMKTLLPLLQQRYHNPLLQSDADMMDEEVIDALPDKYINFLHDILIMLCSVFNVKFAHIQQDVSLWGENADLMNDIHHTASFLYYTLAWEALDCILQENTSSVNYLSRELIKGTNILYFQVKETNMMEKRNPKKPPEKE